MTGAAKHALTVFKVKMGLQTCLESIYLLTTLQQKRKNSEKKKYSESHSVIYLVWRHITLRYNRHDCQFLAEKPSTGHAGI